MYRIVGADQREYGPVTADDVRQWIKEGRANAATIARFESQAWKPLSTFPEFANDLAQASSSIGASQQPYTSSPLYAAPAPPKNHPLAVWGLVLSCVALVPCCCCFSPLFSIAGMGLSFIALAQIRRDPGKWSGNGFAVAGIVIGLVSLVFSALFLLFDGKSLLGRGAFRHR